MAIYCRFCGYQLTESTGLCPQCGRQTFENDTSAQQDSFDAQTPFQPMRDPQQGNSHTQPYFQPTQNPDQSNYSQQPYQPAHNQPYNSFCIQPLLSKKQNPHVNIMSLIGFIIACVSLPLQVYGFVGVFGVFFSRVAGLVSGIIGLVISAAALKQIPRTNEKGRGLSIAGIVISSNCGLLIICLLFYLIY